MIIYLDNDYRCHTTNDGTMRAINTDVFIGKCSEFIEGYRYIPLGETWLRDDGTEIVGELKAPLKLYSQLNVIQSAVDRVQEAADAKQMELLDIIESLILEG